MVRIAKRANRVCVPLSESHSSNSFFSCSSSSSSSQNKYLELVDLDWCIMSTSSDPPVVTQLNERVLAPGRGLITPLGFYHDTDYMFVKKPSDYDHHLYYQNLYHHYNNDHGAKGIPGPVNKEIMDRAFSNFVVGRTPNPLKTPFAELSREEMDVAIRAAFQLGPEFGALISGGATVFVNELESLSGELKKREERIQNLETELSSSKITYDNKLSSLDYEVSKLKAQVKSAMEESGAMKNKNDELQAELSNSKEKIIAEFQKSAAYDQAIVDADDDKSEAMVPIYGFETLMVLSRSCSSNASRNNPFL
ncbi:hypothetical protein POM88_000892 [Heracleum sosnowskyi]|uniref:Uncharacterized protein n=1 Tax=Heracleum sosnowskyi TaxID=360622 RepID=A0AAD8JBI1_9APIA|nr:hypothetical protein POM88_000892 [Heracleum sosnowskyi]